MDEQAFNVTITLQCNVRAKSAAHAEVQIRDALEAAVGPGIGRFGYTTPNMTIRVSPIDDQFDR